MAPNIICYSETLNPAKQWEADNRHTYEMVTAVGNLAWPEMIPNYSMRNAALCGLLAMGVSGAYPFSFAQRGFPNNASKEVKAVFIESSGTHFPSFLTREELETKLGELMILPDQRALALKAHLTELVQELPLYTGDPKNSRIVFWFTAK